MPPALITAGAVWRLMGERNLGLIAAGVGFWALFAIFPAVAALIALVGFWADPAAVEQTVDMAADFLPPEALGLIADQTQRLASVGGGTLGLASILSLALAVWSARLGVGALVQGLTAIYGGPQRNSLTAIVQALALTVVLIAVSGVAVSMMLFVPVVLAVLAPFLPAGSLLPWIAEILRWGVSLGALVIGLGLFYRYGPNRPGMRRSPFLSRGLALALALWAVASVGLTLFMANFGNYNEVYGSIGAVIALLMWLYLSAYAVLSGAALNYVLERQKLSPEPERTAPPATG